MVAASGPSLRSPKHHHRRLTTRARTAGGEQGSSRRPDGDRFGGAPVERERAEPGPQPSSRVENFPPGKVSSFDFRWVVITSMARPSTWTWACSAGRPIADASTVVSSIWIGRRPGGNTDTCSTAVSSSRDSNPTRIPRPSGAAVSTCHPPPTRAARSARAAGSPTSWTASTSGASAMIVAARLSSLA